MRRLTVAAFALGFSLGAALAGGQAAHAKGKVGKGGGKGAAPSEAELAKLKAVRLGDPKAGIFTWGMTHAEVMTKIREAVDARYKDQIEGARNDPGKQQRIVRQRDQEKSALEDKDKGFISFEGQKSGWDVSIVDAEFMQNNGESMLPVKEEIWTRYFFFFEDRLWKMFLAFNKDMIGNKSFRDFGKEMAAKYGNPREVYRDDKVKGGVKRTLDHFEWAVTGTDSLKLVDRSQFYDVYCLVLSDAGTIDRIVAKRKITNPEVARGDALVEAALNSKDNGVDSNDDIIDRVTGHEVKKPGSEAKHGDVVVPMPAAPTPDEVNAGEKGKKDKGGNGKKEKPKDQEKKGSGSGLEL